MGASTAHLTSSPRFGVVGPGNRGVLVVDTSAVVKVLAGNTPDQRLVARLSEDDDLHAPHLIDVEFQHALRRLVLRKQLTMDRAEDVRTDFEDLRLMRYSHQHLAERMWELRNIITPYDAAFVALAELLGASLVTCDSGLARAEHKARTELFGISSY